MTLAMSGATPEDAGLASGLVNTTAQVGGALGLAVLATLSATETDALPRRRREHGDRPQRRLPPGLLVGAGLVLAAIVIALVITRPAREKRARRHRSGAPSPRARRPSPEFAPPSDTGRPAAHLRRGASSRPGPRATGGRA